MSNIIHGRCHTNLDEWRGAEWPTKFVALPRVGDYYRDKGACAGREESELVKHINAALSIPEVSKWVTTRARG